MGLKIDLGGGSNPREGYIAVDREVKPHVAHVVDFERLHPDGPERLPFADESVDAVYSSHTLEHVRPYKGFLWEICRVCRPGASVEIRVPHWLNAMALCNDHKHTVPPEQVDHWCVDYVGFWFGGSPRRLKLLRTEYVPGKRHFQEAKALHPGWSDDQVMRFAPDACHEIGYFFEVICHED